MPPQVQAAIKKNVERQRKRSIEFGKAGDIQFPTPQPQSRRKSIQLAQMATDEVAEDSEALEKLEEKLEEQLEEQLEVMLEGPQRRNVEKEKEAEPVDLLPIVDSMFGQVGLESIFFSVCMCDFVHVLYWVTPG